MTVDYRLSHVEKGAVYDRRLQEAPFDAFMAERERAILSRVVPRLFPHGVDRYLDFACGTGRILATLEPLAREPYGVDISASMLAQARRKCRRSTVLEADLTRDVLDIGRFNLVTAFRFFGNAQDELRIGVIDAVRGLLRAGGYLVLNNHRNPQAVRNRLTGQRDLDLSHAKLRRLLANGGFSIVASYPIAAWVIRDRFTDNRVLQSSWGRALERLTATLPLAPWAPDAVVVARKGAG